MANQKLNTTITIGAVLGTETQRTFGTLKGGLGQVNQSIKEVTRRQKEIGRERTALIKAGQSVDHLDREYQQLENRLQSLTVQQNRWANAVGRASAFGQKFGQMKNQMIGAMRTGAVVGSVYGAAIFGLAKNTAALGDSTAKTADNIGIGIGALQELRYAGERSGVATDALDKSLEQYLKRLGEAQEGTGPAADALKQLGLNAKTMADLPLDEQLAIIADKMQGVEDQSVKAAIANDLFSRNGIALTNMLRGGSEGLTQLREDARKTGYVMSEEAARNSEAFNDALLDAELSAKGAKNTIGAALLPVTTGLMKQFSAWIQDNSGQITAWGNSFGTFAEKSLPILKDTVVGIGKITSFTVKATTATANMVGGWENFGMIIGGVFAAKTILAVGSFTGSVFKLGGALLSITKFTPLVVGGIRAIGMAMMANPIGIAVAVIAGGAYLIYKNWDSISTWFSNKMAQLKTAIANPIQTIKNIWLNFTPSGLIYKNWDSISAWFGQKWKSVKAGAAAGWNNIKTALLNYTPHGLIYKNWDGISAWFGQKWKSVKAGAAAGWNNIKTALLNYTPHGLIYKNWDGISAWFDQTWKSVKAGVAAGWGNIKTALLNYTPHGAIYKNWDGISAWFDQTWETVKNSTTTWGSDFSKIGTGIIDGLIDGIKSKIAQIKETITGIGSDISKWFKDAIGEINLSNVITLPQAPSWLKSPFGEPRQIDGARASGGPVKLGGTYLVGEEGPELVTFGQNAFVHNATYTAAMMTRAPNTPILSNTAPSAAPVTNNNTYTINVTATSGHQAHEIVEEIKRQMQSTRSGHLFDQNSLRIA